MKGDNMTEVNDPSLWWKQAVVYQVYPRSFKDSRGEGLGQIAGVTEKIGYLKELGVDAIWLSPFYPSQLADGGYDVDDYRNVDPKLGSMDDFDALAKAAHADGIKIVVDIVPNHSSNLHEWFKAALAAKPGSPERDRYIVSLRFGLGGCAEKTQKQVADIMGISQSYISRLEKRILNRLQKDMTQMG